MAERTNDQWLEDLEVPGPAQEQALADLRQVILSGLPFALSSWLPRDDPRFDALAEETVQETLMRVLKFRHTFEGRSKFTTWVHKIAVRVALEELRRKRWQNVSLEEMVETETGMLQEKWLADTTGDPARIVEGIDMMARLNRAMMEDLSEKQRRAMIAVVINGVPLEEVAHRMGTNRNALYKLMHDARLKLKASLMREGLSPEDMIASFTE